jgi:hypothetical protein
MHRTCTIYVHDIRLHTPGAPRSCCAEIPVDVHPLLRYNRSIRCVYLLATRTSLKVYSTRILLVPDLHFIEEALHYSHHLDLVVLTPARGGGGLCRGAEDDNAGTLRGAMGVAPHGNMER